MSLVAYDCVSSDEEETDDSNDECESTKLPVKNVTKKELLSTEQNELISDEDDDYMPEEPMQPLKKSHALSLLLPKPKKVVESISLAANDSLASTFAKLPMPKAAAGGLNEIIEEEDDEFLRITPLTLESKTKPPPPPSMVKGSVKITIPSLRDFNDVDEDLASSVKNKTKPGYGKPKGSGLLSVLPKAKSEQNFIRSAEKSSTKPLDKNVTKNDSAPTRAAAFIPDTVKNRRPAHNTEFVDGIKNVATRKTKVTLVECSESEEEDEKVTTDFAGDFFSLNAAADKLPDVSDNEIKAMVAKSAAKMAAATTKYLSETVTKTEQKEHVAEDTDGLRMAQKRFHDQQLDAEAMQALVGSSAKRRRGRQPEINVMEISSAEVLPNRDEWMRTALASSTTYQPTGVLTDEEPAAGTRRKHQITYLAHKAKSNEAELQAMWAANRQNRRATQSKYGF